ncbi:MAG: MFS transporter [Silvanigrellaceae bacterium]|nr:MFS transporter [Silvanigrellaceae bacterium]
MTTHEIVQEEELEKIKKSVLISVFITIFIDLIGFGMFIPILPILAREFGSTDAQAALLGTYYSLANMAAVLILGRISDKVGRKKVLLISIAIASVAQLGAGLAQSYFILVITRIIAGFSCGNLPAAQSAIADITTPQERTKYMTIIGLAFGAGFALGPIIASGVLLLCESFDFLKTHHFLAIASFSALLNLLNLLYVTFKMPETHRSYAQGKVRAIVQKVLLNQPKEYEFKGGFFRHLKNIVKTPGFIAILSITFLQIFAMIGIETLMPLFLKDAFQLSDVFVYSTYIFLGLCMLFTNGYLSKVFFLKFGDIKTLQFGLFFIFLGVILIPIIAPHSLLLSVCLFFFALGVASCNPALMGITSKITSVENQGFAFGITQSVGSLARVIGPAFMGIIYETGMGIHSLTKVNSLYISGVIMMIGLVVNLYFFKNFEKKSS